MEYDKKVAFAIKLLQSIPQDDGPVEISYSGGKDSDVILELAKMAEIPFEAIYKNTTCDRPGTMKHVREVGATVIQPKKNMLQLIEAYGWPYRMRRFCCGFLKEYKVKNRAVHGIRKSESPRRAKLYKEPEVCRIYGQNKKNKVRVYLPILDWTDEDVIRFLSERGIKCHQHYYDEYGRFHVERRVGCIGCPMQSDNGVSDFKEYPSLFAARFGAYKKWFYAHPDAKSVKTFRTPYNAIYMKLFCKDMQEYNDRIATPLFAEYQLDTKEYLEKYFNVKLD